MVIKLVQTDSVDSFKITLSVGEHPIGRGKLLGCEDKRISRNHGQLDVYEDHILMKSLHQNPCFYLKKDTQEKQILKKDCVISLTNGDRLGLLPDAFWYEVLYCTSLDEPPQDNDTEEMNTEEYCAEQNGTGNEKTNVDASIFTSSPHTDIKEDDRTGSPSLIAPINDNTVENINKPPSPQNQEDNTDCEFETETLNSSNEQKNKEQDKSNEAVKRSHSIDKVEDNKKIKTEPVEDGTDSVENRTDPVEVKTEAVEVKTEPKDVKTESHDVKPGPSADQPDHNAAVNNNVPGPANANRPLRERCMYGGNCYRKNPGHFAQFSHPRDSDWGPGARAPCPQGGGCMKTDPRHHRDHYHPDGHVPPPPMGMRLFERYGNLYYIDAAAQVNFYDDRFVVVDSEGDSVDHDYEF